MSLHKYLIEWFIYRLKVIWRSIYIEPMTFFHSIRIIHLPKDYLRSTYIQVFFPLYTHRFLPSCPLFFTLPLHRNSVLFWGYVLALSFDRGSGRKVELSRVCPMRGEETLRNIESGPRFAHDRGILITRSGVEYSKRFTAFLCRTKTVEVQISRFARLELSIRIIHEIIRFLGPTFSQCNFTCGSNAVFLLDLF